MRSRSSVSGSSQASVEGKCVSYSENENHTVGTVRLVKPRGDPTDHKRRPLTFRGFAFVNRVQYSETRPLTSSCSAIRRSGICWLEFARKWCPCWVRQTGVALAASGKSNGYPHHRSFLDCEPRV